MKATKLFLSAIAFVGVFAACNPEDKPDNGGDSGKETPEVEKSKECRLTAFTVTAGDFEIEGFIDQTDKTIELSYMPNQFAALASATAEVKISDKATISPDPAVARDYTVEGGVEFTVTAEDGTTTSVYTVYAAAAEVSVKVEKKWSKTYGQMTLAASTSNMCGLGFVDREHFATSDFNVYDLEGNAQCRRHPRLRRLFRTAWCDEQR